jgi:peroxiredoxin
LRRDHERFREAGAEIVAVGQGSLERTAAFVADLGLPYRVLGDPARTAYRAYGLTEGSLGQIFSAAAGRGVLRAFRHGARGGRVTGSATQLPGAFVVDRVGIIRYARPGRHAADTPGSDELLAAVAGL